MPLLISAEDGTYDRHPAT